jgi:membrane protease YdiL (CAAX protease family)
MRPGTLKQPKLAIPLIVTLLVAFMDVTGLPVAPFVQVNIADVNPAYFALIANQFFAILFCLVLMHFLYPRWPFSLGKSGLVNGLRKYGVISAVAAIVVFVAFYLGLAPLDNSPTVLRVLVESVAYNVSLAVIEELYIRGLLLNVLRSVFAKSERGVLWAVVLSSAIFGLGHIPGAIGQPLIVVIGQVIWTFGLGVFLGAVYVKTANLWCPIICHYIINLAGFIYCFSTQTSYPTISLTVIIPLFLVLGIYGVTISLKLANSPEHKLKIS